MAPRPAAIGRLGRAAAADVRPTDQERPVRNATAVAIVVLLLAILAAGALQLISGR
jgi:hypothetical protein